MHWILRENIWKWSEKEKQQWKYTIGWILEDSRGDKRDNYVLLSKVHHNRKIRWGKSIINAAVIKDGIK